MRYKIDEMPGWCAGAKVSLCEGDIKHANLSDMIEQVVERIEASVIIISVNEDEEKVIDWCKANKFKKGPFLKNWGHSGRRTYLYFYQINKATYNMHGGCNWDYN